ncbi:MAG: peroxiredoxin family protein [Pseudomonadota bacterium]|nr:peroxiredoxin family protein [Pseudomonadota bacterium]
MNRLKSLFISLYLSLLSLGLVRALWLQSAHAEWWWVVLALAPGLGFFGWVFAFNVARTGRASVVMWLGPVLSTVGLLMQGVVVPEIWCWVLGVGLLGAGLYIRWYSVFVGRDSAQLQPGTKLPDIALQNAQGETLQVNQIEGPLLLLFYRGNWCPLCMAQIREVADQYAQLAAKGVALLMISPQSHANTAALAQKFDVPMQFLVDVDLQAAKALGIEALAGLPAGLEALGYDSDTVMPTVIITDGDHRILYADQTDNYRVRPEPDAFLQVLAQAGL